MTLAKAAQAEDRIYLGISGKSDVNGPAGERKSHAAKGLPRRQLAEDIGWAMERHGAGGAGDRLSSDPTMSAVGGISSPVSASLDARQNRRCRIQLRADIEDAKPEAPPSDEFKRQASHKAKIRRFNRQRAAQCLLPEYRALAGCMRNAFYREARPGVDVILNTDSGRARFGNVQTCGSVWACPVCAHRITEERRADLQAAITVHAMKGNRVLMVTLTFPHEARTPLKELRRKQQKALKDFNSMRRYRRLLDAVGWIGSVKATEVTHGENGWHPHVHTLLFVGAMPETELLEILEGARDLWARAVFKAGLGHINEHGFDVRGGDKAAEYVAKYGHEPKEETAQAFGWTAAHEMTKAPVKNTHGKNSRTPFALLDDYLKGDAQSGALFVEYVEAMKGSRQLYWSPDLRNRLKLDAERTDEEIAADAHPEEPQTETADPQIEEERHEEIVCTLSEMEWKTILRANVRGHVLVLAERHGAAGVRYLLDLLRGKPPKDDDGFAWIVDLVGWKGMRQWTNRQHYPV
ncbi:MAG: protein rep [Rhodocyclaceae bacterium]|nr:protein rep [Rhodocyclaceae bacterium]